MALEAEAMWQFLANDAWSTLSSNINFLYLYGVMDDIKPMKPIPARAYFYKKLFLATGGSFPQEWKDELTECRPWTKEGRNLGSNLRGALQKLEW